MKKCQQNPLCRLRERAATAPNLTLLVQTCFCYSAFGVFTMSGQIWSFHLNCLLASITVSSRMPWYIEEWRNFVTSLEATSSPQKLITKDQSSMIIRLAYIATRHENSSSNRVLKCCSSVLFQMYNSTLQKKSYKEKEQIVPSHRRPRITTTYIFARLILQANQFRWEICWGPKGLACIREIGARVSKNWWQEIRLDCNDSPTVSEHWVYSYFLTATIATTLVSDKTSAACLLWEKVWSTLKERVSTHGCTEQLLINAAQSQIRLDTPFSLPARARMMHIVFSMRSWHL